MIINGVDQINQRLALFDGGIAKVWLFDVSLTRLLLRIHRNGVDTVLGLLAVTCSKISGPFSWNVSRLAVSQDNRTARIEDVGASFLLECASYVLFERTELGILKSLEELADEQ